jgi:hypothetical protein
MHVVQRPGPETFDSFQSAGAQLTQTAHFALQLPYTIFGLGMAPNFVDYLWVNISGKTHSWPQIIPNSQLYIIPYPPNQPDSWAAKISIFPSKGGPPTVILSHVRFCCVHLSLRKQFQ